MRLELNGEVFYDIEETDSKKLERYKKNFANHISFQGGESNQTIHPLLADIENTNTLPRLKKTSVLWLRNIDLSNYGNTFPTAQVIVKSQQQYPSVGALLRGIIDFSEVNDRSQEDFGFDVLSVDLRVNKIPFYGSAFMLDGTTPLSWMQPFVESWNLKTVTQNGRSVIDTILPYDELTYETIDLSVADLLGIEGEAPYEIKTLGGDTASSQLALTYIDIDSESTPQVAYASLNRALNSNNVTTFDIKTIMPAALANTLVERMLRNLWAKNKIITFSLPITALGYVTNGTLVRINGDDIISDMLWLIISPSFGDKGFIEYSGVEFNPAHYAFSADNVSNLYNSDLLVPATVLEQVRFELLDIPPLSDTDGDRLAPYYALGLSDFGAPVYLYSSTNGTNYQYLQLLNKESLFGTIESGDATLMAPELLYQNTSVEVSFSDLNADLYSTSLAGWVAGKQLFVYQGCIFSYKSAQFIGTSSDNRWKITGLIAGFRGTGTSVPIFDVGALDRDVIFIKNDDITPNSLASTLSPSFFGTHYAKLGISTSDDLTDNLVIDQSFNQVKARAASVQILPAKVFTNGTIQLRWVGRSTDDNAFTLLDETAQPTTTRDGTTYSVKIYQSYSNTLVRSVTVVNNTIYNYTLAQQNADGGNTNITDLYYLVTQQSNHKLLGVVTGTPYDIQVL